MAHVAIGLSIVTTDWVVIVGAGKVAFFDLSREFFASTTVGNGNGLPQKTSLGSQLAHVPVGLTIITANGVEIKGASDVAFFNLSGEFFASTTMSDGNRLPQKTSLGGQLAHVTIGLTIIAANGIEVVGTGNVALFHLGREFFASTTVGNGNGLPQKTSLRGQLAHVTIGLAIIATDWVEI